MSPTPAAGGIRLAPIDPAAYRHTPWKNGGGVTIDFAEFMLPGIRAGQLGGTGLAIWPDRHRDTGPLLRPERL